MPDLSDFLEEEEHQDERRPVPQHPKGWEPGVEWDGSQGAIHTGPVAGPVGTWDDLLRSWDLDPDEVEVLEPVQRRSWEVLRKDGTVERLNYYRASLRRKRASGHDITALESAIADKAPWDGPVPEGPAAFLVGFADWQVGKRGSPEAVQRIADAIDRSVYRLRELHKLGRTIGSVYLAGLGDLGEACQGHYDMQTYEVMLNDREQRRVIRRLILYGIDAFLPYAERIVLPAVPGNHGEKRRDGKAYTSFGDNADVEAFETVAEVVKRSPRYDKVSFVIPGDSLTLTLDIGGTLTALAHGHQAKQAGHPVAKVAQWWSGQSFGMRPPGDAKVLVSGHFHSLAAVTHGPRTHLQCPTEDNGSQWFDEVYGTGSLPGMLTVRMDGATANGWDDLRIV